MTQRLSLAYKHERPKSLEIRLLCGEKQKFKILEEVTFQNCVFFLRIYINLLLLC